MFSFPPPSSGGVALIEMLNVLEAWINIAGYTYLRLDGSTQKRGRVVDRFQSGDGPPVMLVSLKAGGTGLNLTAADHVFLLDPWWNPAVENQATDRAFRIGQTRTVNVHKMITTRTLEERIDQMISGIVRRLESMGELVVYLAGLEDHLGLV